MTHPNLRGTRGRLAMSTAKKKGPAAVKQVKKVMARTKKAKRTVSPMARKRTAATIRLARKQGGKK